jgi:ATP-dependent DNA helicase RecG
VTIRVTVLKHFPSRRRGLPYRVTVIDETGEIDLVWFNGRKQYLEDLLPIGGTLIVSGKLEFYKKKKQIIHPQYIVSDEKSHNLPNIEAVYGLTQGLTNKVISNHIKRAIDIVPDFPEWQDKEFFKKMKWPSFTEALKISHNPTNEIDIDHKNPARQRLAYDELLANQLSLALLAKNFEAPSGQSIKKNNALLNSLYKNIPFELTNSQKVAIDEISKGLEKPNRMIRLLQGDVGSGKTIVALTALFQTAGNSKQAALMAPTELLARQHYESIKNFCLKSNIKVEILTGKTKKLDRERIVNDLSIGEIDIILGTHALFQDKISFHNLGLVVIDEQHRFGVHQRLSLTSKNSNNPPDIIIMSATPIPRTLELTAYGSMQVSRLLEKPLGRKPIKTIAKPLDKVNEAIESLKRLMENGEKAYWVCPLIEESEKIDLAAAEDRFISLKSVYGDNVGLVHGRMSIEEREETMREFKYGNKNILVATTVIEVGIDVSDATFIVIEHSERFGLSQLHQLRGRVGRSDRPSSCLLLYRSPLGENAKKRIETLRETDDGFIIAEEDLILRGAGEVLGTKQSGLPYFKIANLTTDRELLETARNDSNYIIENGLLNNSDRGNNLKILLHLFNKEEALKYLDAG